MMWISHF